MSLINKMLQDLEERKSGAEVLGNWQGQVRAAPEARSRGFNWNLTLGLVCVAAVTGGLVWWLNTEQAAPVIAAPQPTVQHLPPLGLKLDRTPASLTDAPASQVPDSADAAMPLQAAVSEPADVPAFPTDANRAPVNDKGRDQGAAVSMRAASQPAAGIDYSKAHVADTSAPAGRLVSSSPAEPAPAQTVSASPRNSSLAKAGVPASGPAEGTDDTALMPVKVSKQVTELTPSQRAENEYRRALTLIEQGKSREASNLLEQALSTDPRHTASRQTLAALLIDGKRTDEAMRILSDGLNMDRSQAGLAMMLARLQVDRLDVRAAIQTLQGSLPHANERADYRAFMAALLQREARHKEAIDHYLAALGRTPNNGIWWMGIGISLQSENRLPEARDAFSRAKMSGSLSAELQAFVEQKIAQLR